MRCIGLLLALLVAGCAPKVSIVSDKVAGINPPHRILLVTILSDANLLTYFPDAAEQQLRGCGVETERFVRTRQQIALAMDLNGELREKVAREKPDALLLVSLRRATLTGPARVVDGATYSVTLTTASGKPFWKAEVVIGQNNSFTDNVTFGRILAEEVVKRLRADGILTGCMAKPA
jgi:ABC-type sugar transport system substrate-binding protein